LSDPYNIPGQISNGRAKFLPQNRPNVFDDNSFLGHEVGAWRGSEMSWRDREDLNRTLTPQPEHSVPRLMQGVPQDSFRMNGSSELSFAAGDPERKAPSRDEVFHSGRITQGYDDSSHQQSVVDPRLPNGRGVVGDRSQGSGSLRNGGGGGGGRYLAVHDARPSDIVAGLCSGVWHATACNAMLATIPSLSLSVRMSDSSVVVKQQLFCQFVNSVIELAYELFTGTRIVDVECCYGPL